jgi:TonB family protein
LKRIARLLWLCLPVASTLAAQEAPPAGNSIVEKGSIPAPSPGKLFKRPSCAPCEEIDRLLGRGDWAAAEARARAAIAAYLQEKGGELVTFVSQLAVAEAGQGRDEDALWHWQEAGWMGCVPDASHYGAPGQRLAGTSRRKFGQAPDGLVVRYLSDDGSPLTPARKISGGEIKLPGTYRNYPRGIRVEVIVDREGRVRQPVVAGSTLDTLTYVALEAMRGWRFTPAQSGAGPVASFYELKVPEQRPLDRLADFNRSPLAEPLAMLKAGHFAEADKKLHRIWRDFENDAEQTRAFLGVALALKALSEAGLGREDSAICRFQAAQTLEPRLYGADLSAFGAPGALLMRHPWGAPVASSERCANLEHEREVTKPERRSGRIPAFPDYARNLRIEGKVVIESILTESGVLRNVLLLQPGPSAGLDASALDAICDWRFKPATLQGIPVRVYYTLTVNFEVPRR